MSDIERAANELGVNIVAPLAYGGKEGCRDARCRRIWKGEGADLGPCQGWHCSYCDEPCGPQGHRCDVSEALVAEAKRAKSEQDNP